MQEYIFWLFIASFLLLINGCAVPANVVADAAFECGKNGQKMNYLYRVFDGGVMRMECE